MVSSGTVKLLEPICQRGRTKSTWHNFEAQANAIARDPKHIIDYFMSELGCTGNLGSSNEMVLVGGYQQKHFLRLIRKYISDFVMCANCKGLQTELDKKDRLTWLTCKKCKASRTVGAISNRFVATKRGQRKKEKRQL